MKKFKKVLYVIISVVIFAGAIAAALDFMGVINLKNHDQTEDETLYSELWHIVFKGYAFSVKPAGIAIIHESGCLNIRSTDEYLVQIDVEDDSADDFWNDRDGRVQHMKESGYTMEQYPEKIRVDDREYIRYIVSMKEERGAEYDSSYFCVLISDAGDDKRFLTVVRFDGTDIAAMDTASRNDMYEKAIDEAACVTSSAVPTDETNDMTGSYWQADGYSGTFSSDVVKEEYTDAELVDSIANEDIYVSYEIPENFILLRDDQTGKSYYSEADKSQVIVSVIPYTWKSAADMAEDSNSAGISKVTAEGQYEEKGKIYYYYAYSILRIRNGTRKTSYYFNAYTDLEDGNIYSINGFADDSPEIMTPKTYTRFMSITEE